MRRPWLAIVVLLMVAAFPRPAAGVEQVDRAVTPYEEKVQMVKHLVRQPTAAELERERLYAIREKSNRLGKWVGSHKDWDKLAIMTLKEKGVNKKDIKRLMWIHHHESKNPNVKGGYKKRFWGGWQLYYKMCKGRKWWDPVWASKRALKYCKGHHGSVYKAYKYKKRYGVY